MCTHRMRGANAIILWTLLLAMSSAKTRQQQSSINLQWINSNLLTIRWDDYTTTDIITLSESQVIPGIHVPCLFSGKFAKNPSYTAAIVGCMHDTEVIVNIGLHNGSVRELILKNGVTFEDDWVSREKREAPNDDDILDESPKELTLPLTIGYDTSFFEYFKG